MTVEERAKQVMANWKKLGKEFDYGLIPGTNLAELIFTEWIADALRDQIEDCAKIADEYWTPPEKQEGCDLCEVGHSISEEIRGLGALNKENLL